MAIAHVVVDLPIDEHFDYSIPTSLQDQITPGKRVRVSFGSKLLTGFVIGISAHSPIAILKPIKRIIDEKPIFDKQDVVLSRAFASYYGVSLGEALSTLLGNVTTRELKAIPQEQKDIILHEIHDGKYISHIERLIERNVKEHAVTVICVPDISFNNRFQHLTKKFPRVVIVTRSALHMLRGAGSVLVIDEDNPSYAQEQKPKYHARILILMMAKFYAVPIHFLSLTPSVELKVLVEEGKIQHLIIPCARRKPMVVDVHNYHSKGLITPAALSAIDASLKSGGKVLLYLNRRGNYAITRCQKCSKIVTCIRCDASLAYDKSKHQLSCRLCSTHIPAQGLTCAQCASTDFKSVGVGVSQLKNQMDKLFPTTCSGIYQQDDKPQSLPSQQLVIATHALFTLKENIHFSTAVIIDIDREINRLDMRSSFNAWSLVEHLRTMSSLVIIQTRQPDQEMLISLARDDRDMFYNSEKDIRRELGFSPYGHWLKVVLRARDEKLVKDAAVQLYTILKATQTKDFTIHPVAVDTIAKQRDQYRFMILLQGLDVRTLVSFVKKAQAGMKRYARLYITYQVD